jgi:hypothetical protein
MAQIMYTFADIEPGVSFIAAGQLYVKTSKTKAAPVRTKKNGAVTKSFKDEDPVQFLRKLSAQGSAGGRCNLR